ncbi:MAG: PIN domain-containing protein [Syntrophobacteraceae bacterium]
MHRSRNHPTLSAIQDRKSVQILPVTEATWLLNLELQREHRAPADRTIVATASQLGCRLITSDRMIQAIYAASVS